MSNFVQGPLSVLARVLLSTIFFMAAVGNKIPHFSDVAKVMASVGIPAPQLMLVGAIVFLIAGSLSVIVGYHARFGAALLLTFLVVASYYFHPFWRFEGQAQQEVMIHFMKNLSMMGAMVFVMANGSGAMSLDSLLHKRVTADSLSGMGLATAKLFAAEGAKVVITGRRQDALDEAAKTVGHSVLTVQGDVSKMADLDRSPPSKPNTAILTYSLPMLASARSFP